MKRFSKKETAFIYWKARGYNLTESVLKAGYKAKSRLIASSYGNKLMQKVEVKTAIEEEKANIFDKSVITDESTLGRANELYVTTKDSDIKVRLLNFFADCLGMKKQQLDFKDITPPPTQSEKDEYNRMTGRVLN